MRVSTRAAAGEAALVATEMAGPSRRAGGTNWESRHLGGGDRPLGRLLVDDAELEDADEPGHDHDDDGEVSG